MDKYVSAAWLSSKLRDVQFYGERSLDKPLMIYHALGVLWNDIQSAPEADVVPKSEVDNEIKVWQELYADTVSKWEEAYEKLEIKLEKAKAELAELKKDRYQMLPDGMLELLPRTDIDKIKSDVAMEIFEEIENGIKAAISALQFASAFHRGAKHEAYSSVMRFIKTIEKKYTPQCTTCKHMLSCEPNVFGICDEYEEEETKEEGGK